MPQSLNLRQIVYSYLGLFFLHGYNRSRFPVILKNKTTLLIVDCVPPYLYSIHKYLRQFRYSYWLRARHVGVYKPLYMASKKC